MVSIIIEIIISLIIIGFQITFYRASFKKIIQLTNIFPIDGMDKSNIDRRVVANTEVEQIVVEDNLYQKNFIDIVISINEYLARNKGAADFSIIKSIVDRNVEVVEEDVTSNVSLPLYVGLMGTFLGIIVGLFEISYRGVTETTIESFIGGVFIAMIASFLGLLLTVVNNSRNYKNAKRINDRRKNKFFHFLHVELLPYLGSNIYDVFDRFKNNISDFNAKFSKSISLFDDRFSDNINNLKESVNTIADNIQPVIDNTVTQRDFLRELKSIGYNRMAEANLKVFRIMNDAGPNFIQFIEKQKELNQSIDKTLTIVTKIDNLMNRVSLFEESINNLGSRIDNADYMGSDLLNKVNKKLSDLDDQFELLKQHSQYSKGQIEYHFVQETKKVEALSQQILNNINDALTFDTEKNPLQKLLVLDIVKNQLEDIKVKLSPLEENKNVARELSDTKHLIVQIKEEIQSGTSAILMQKHPKQTKVHSEQTKAKKDTFFHRINPFKRKAVSGD
jgi:hypothetical protein